MGNRLAEHVLILLAVLFVCCVLGYDIGSMEILMRGRSPFFERVAAVHAAVPGWGVAAVFLALAALLAWALVSLSNRPARIHAEDWRRRPDAENAGKGGLPGRILILMAALFVCCVICFCIGSMERLTRGRSSVFEFVGDVCAAVPDGGVEAFFIALFAVLLLALIALARR